MGYQPKNNLLETWGLSHHINGGHIKIRQVRCASPARKCCPHAYYAYHITVNGLGRKEKYLGQAQSNGKPRGWALDRIKKRG